MKKLTKILIVALTVCLLVGITAIAVFANTEPQVSAHKTFGIDGKPFVVADDEGGYVGYDNFQTAATAAGGTKTVYLNQDVTAASNSNLRSSWLPYGQTKPTGATWYTTQYSPSSSNVGKTTAYQVVGMDVIFDMNGYTITQNFEGSVFFIETGTLTIVGGGEMKDVANVAHISTNGNLVIDVTQKLTISNLAHSVDEDGVTVLTQGRWPLFFMRSENSSISFTGDVHIKLANEATAVIDALTTRTWDNTNGVDVYTKNSISFDAANVVVDYPSAEQTDASSAAVNYFVVFRNGTTVNVANASRLKIDYGVVFNVNAHNQGACAGGYIDVSEYLGGKVIAPSENTKPEYVIKEATWPAYLNVSDSEIISGADVKEGYSSTSAGSVWGSIVYVEKVPLMANFTDCYIEGGGSRMFATSDVDLVTNNQTATNQFYFKDCELKANANHKFGREAIFNGLVNAVWDGGYIDCTDNRHLTYETFYYHEYADGEHFFGVLVKNARIDNTGTHTEATSETALAKWQYYWKPEGTLIKDYKYLEDGVLKTASNSFAVFDSEHTELTDNYVVYQQTGAGMTNLDYSVKVDGTSSGTAQWTAPIFGFSTNMKADISELRDASGNAYFEAKIPGGTTTGALSKQWYNAVPGTNTSKYAYYVNEFDIAAVGTKWFDVPSGNWPYYNFQYELIITPYTYKADGTKTAGTNAWPGDTVRIDDQGVRWNSTGANPSVISAGGEWHRITVVQELIATPVAGGINIKASDAADTYRKVPGYKVDYIWHLYVDGIHVESIDRFPDTTVHGHYLDESNPSDAKDYFTEDELASLNNRDIKFAWDTRTTLNSDSGIRLDNYRQLGFDKATYGENFKLPGFNGTTSPIESLEGHKFLNVLPENDSTPDPVAVGTVNGVEYFDEAALNAAITENSVVQVLKSFENPIELNAPFTLKLNGNTIPGFTSSEYAPIAYSTIGIYKTRLAEESEKKTFTFEYAGVSDSATSVVGTLINVPDALNPELVNLYEIADKTQDSATIKTLTGWNITGTDSNIVTADAVSVTAVADSSDAVVVVWNGDYDEPIVQYYNPTVEETLKAPAFKTPVNKTVSDWYKLVKTWKQSDLDAVNLKTAGKYEVGYQEEQEAWVNLKVNLTLYASFRLNIYVPAVPSEVTNFTISTKEDGTSQLLVRDTGTLNDKDVSQYYLDIGLSDTSIQTFYLKYTLGGDNYTYSFSYGVPYYVAEIMSPRNSATDYGENAKALIINMINYNYKFLEMTGGDTTTPGAQLYKKLLDNDAKLATPYLNTYENQSFLTGDIYEAEISRLNLNSDNEASYLIDSYSIYFDTFRPQFMFKYSAAAVELGITEPKENGNCAWTQETAGINAKLRRPQSSSMYEEWETPMAHMAWTANTEPAYGTGITTGQKIWATGTEAAENNACTSAYDYYVLTYNLNYNHGIANVESNKVNALPYTIKDMGDKLTIVFEVNDSTDKSKTFETKYFEFNAASYAASVIELYNESKATSEDVELAKAFYAFAKAAQNFTANPGE